MVTTSHGDNRHTLEVQDCTSSSLEGVEPPPPKVTVKQAAEAVGRSERSVKSAKKVLDHGDDTLIEAVKAGDMSTAEAEAEVRRREKAAAAAQRIEDAKERRAEKARRDPDFKASLHHCPVADMSFLVAAGSVDAVVTDPPYQPSDLTVWTDLARFASHALKPGGLLLALSGAQYLPEVLAAMQAGCFGDLSYHWMLSYRHSGQGLRKHFKRRWLQAWKPVIVYQQGPSLHEFERDEINYDPADLADAKDRHRWGQAEAGVLEMLRIAAAPGDLVADPFLGGATTMLACQSYGCRFVGCDIDQSMIDQAEEMLR